MRHKNDRISGVYACIYCQLGRTDHMTNTRRYFYPVEEITGELDRWLAASPDGEAGFDVVTVVGEGNRPCTPAWGRSSGKSAGAPSPVAVITNGALLSDPAVAEELMEADMVLPSLDAWDETPSGKSTVPYGRLHFGGDGGRAGGLFPSGTPASCGWS